MDKRVLTTVIVVILGVILGVAIVGKKANDPVLREVLRQQTEILDNQKAMQARGGVATYAPSADNNSAGSSTAQLEARVARLEQQLVQLGTLLKGLSQQQPQQQAGPPPEDYSTQHEIPVAHSPVLGPKDAPVTVVEFVDFECPFCARFHIPVKEAVDAYPQKVNYMIKNFPLSFHAQARPAAKAAFAAGEQGKYWEMADKLLENGKSLNEEKFKDIAGELGLNVDKFMKDYREKDAQWEDYIKKDMQLGQEVNVRGTPTIYIHGRKSRARDVASIKQEIEKALSE